MKDQTITGTLVQAPSEDQAQDRLNLSKAGEAKSLYKDKQRQIQADHKLALKLREEEEAELQKVKEKEESNLKYDNTPKSKPKAKRRC